MNAIQIKPVPTCPNSTCGRPMVLKKPASDQDWEPFWGCTGYPRCKRGRSIGLDGKPVYLEDNAPVWASGQWE